MRIALTILALLLATVAAAQQAIPTPEDFLGYRLGEQFTTYDRIVAYFDELGKRSNLIAVEASGQTYEGRPLLLATITSPKNRAALETIRKNTIALAHADSIDAARAKEIAESTPVVVWLAFGIHGNESSSSEAAMLVARELMNDPALLENAVVLIDPLENPDGRERYIQWFRRMRGEAANPNPDAFEHQEPWPGGRYNHYLIDMNRDWTWMSQRETQARVEKYRRWYPQVFVDFHEMSAQSSYFFPPDAKPINANLPRQVEKWLEVFGRANAAEFSKRGWPFFVAERFDLFYPGYGDAWPSLHGAIGMTYEMAGGGRAGSAVLRDDGTTLTLADRVQRHFTTAMATVRTAAANRAALLQYTYDAMRVHVDGARTTYLIVPGSPNFTSLLDMLHGQGVRISTLTGSANLRATRLDRQAAESRSFPAGTAVISTGQPFGGLVETLLERHAELAKEFLEEQRTKTEADEPDDFYDLTTWSLPLAMNVEAYVAAGAVSGAMKPYAPPEPAPFRQAAYGYLVSAMEPNFYRLAGELFRDEIRFSVAETDLLVGDRTYPRGSLVILKGNNEPALDDTLRASSVAMVPLESGWLGGTAFGSEKLRYVKPPRIALMGGPGTAPTSFGMLWHTLDIGTPIPHTVINADSLRNLDLSRYNVIVLPDGDYGARFGKRETEKLQAWLRGGGTIVAIKDASRFLRDKDVEISKLKPWEPPKKKDEEPPAADARYNEPRVPGSAFRTTMSERSYLTFGIPRPPAVLIEGSAAYRPLSHRVDNIVTVVSDDPLLSGVAWQDSIDRIKGSIYLVSEPFGRGNVITFADEPHFRLFWRGTLPLFLNAVIYSPSFPR
jgi:hypothetical protein